MTLYLQLLERIFPRGLPNTSVQTIVRAVVASLEVNFDHFDDASESDLNEIRFALTAAVCTRRSVERSEWVN